MSPASGRDALPLARVSHPAAKSGRRDPGSRRGVRLACAPQGTSRPGRALSGSPGTGNSASGRARSLRALDAQPRRPSGPVGSDPRQRPLGPGAGLQGRALIKERTPRFHPTSIRGKKTGPPEPSPFLRRISNVCPQVSCTPPRWSASAELCLRGGSAGAPRLIPRPRSMCLLKDLKALVSDL